MASIASYKCPNCGGSVPFNAKTGKLTCGFCNTSFDIENVKDETVLEEKEVESVDWGSHESETIKTDNEFVYVCPSCGGELITDKNTAATSCPYCDTPIVFKEQLSGMIKPDLIIPFSLTKEDAKNKYLEHISNKILLPDDFKINNIIEKLNGIYVPYWLFDADVRASASFHVTDTNVYRSGDYEVTETKHYREYRSGDASFEKVPVDASVKLDDGLLDSIEPFIYSESKEFNTAYLSNYLADRYDKDMKESIPKANDRINSSMISLLRNTVIGYDTVSLEHYDSHFSNTRTNYALFPLYIFTTRYKDELYQFAMNGQTGKFSGNLPIDYKKLIFFILKIFVPIFVVLTIVAYIAFSGDAL